MQAWKRANPMLIFFESTWPFWWILTILVLLRWFHVNVLRTESSEDHTATIAPPVSHNTDPQVI